MNFDWEEFLKLSKNIIVNNSVKQEVHCDAIYRTCVSRAYYAAFLQTRKCFSKSDTIDNNQHRSIHTGKNSVHGALQNELIYSGNGKKKKIGVKLKDLFKWRKICDYELDSNTDLKMMAQNSIKTSTNVFSILNSIKH